jgi:hypothetical protein
VTEILKSFLRHCPGLGRIGHANALAGLFEHLGGAAWGTEECSHAVIAVVTANAVGLPEIRFLMFFF